MKQLVLDEIKKQLQKRIDDSQKAISNAQASANEETKSSAGDKYETGRAMNQLSIEMYQRQFYSASSELAIVENIEAKLGKSNVAGNGSLVTSTMGVFFISVGIGKIKIGVDEVFAISSASPIGELLFLKKVDDSVDFRGKAIKILAID